MSSPPVLRTSDDFVICNACGTQFPVTEASGKDECKVCDDPRQYVPPEGQTFTTMAKLKESGHRNVWRQDEKNPNIWAIKTKPNFAIGERALLLRTPAGNVLWDLIPFLDQETVDKIAELGGLKAIVISHPHYYSTWADWSRTLSCPVYVGAPDVHWFERNPTPGAEIRPLEVTYTPILPDSGITAIVVGGHFDGSALLLWEGVLFIADTIFTSQSGKNPVPGKPGVTSFSFFWSIPNYIPLHPDAVHTIWKLVKPLDFHTTMGAFEGQDVRTMENEHARRTGGVKGRLLESCKIYTRGEGWTKHDVFDEIL